MPSFPMLRRSPKRIDAQQRKAKSAETTEDEGSRSNSPGSPSVAEGSKSSDTEADKKTRVSTRELLYEIRSRLVSPLTPQRGKKASQLQQPQLHRTEVRPPVFPSSFNPGFSKVPRWQMRICTTVSCRSFLPQQPRPGSDGKPKSVRTRPFHQAGCLSSSSGTFLSFEGPNDSIPPPSQENYSGKTGPVAQ